MRIYIETQGCSLNQADTESMAGYLEQEGHQLVDAQEDADVVVYNTCTVKNPTEDSFLARLTRQKKPVVVAGCIPQADKQGLLDGYVQLGTKQLHNITHAVHAAAHKQQYIQIGSSTHERLNTPKVRLNPYVEIVPICAGCLSSCTYCKTKQARGNLVSYRPSDIEQQVRSAVDGGVKEVWLTSQDNGAYGMDIGTNPGELLERVARIEGDFMIRFGMTNPDWTKKWLPELIRAYKHPKVYMFLHLPIQAGSDAVLRHMRRRCTAQDIRDIVTAFRAEIPGITIATDIICGYPTETEEDFAQTLALVNELAFPIIHISKFYPRPDTPAAGMNKLPTEVVKSRSRELTRLFESAAWREQHAHLLGTEQLVRFVEKKGDSYIGRTEQYLPVIVHTDQDLLGTTRRVHITHTTRDDIRGHVLEA